jgi:large subunit ribosomal protein L13
MQRNTYKIDATGMVLGRLATDIAMHLMGKHLPTYQAHIDSGDVVIVTNVAKMKVTGKKMEQKVYRRHSGFPGGLKEKSMTKMMEDNPADVLKAAVSRMLPKNKLRDPRLNRLNIS